MKNNFAGKYLKVIMATALLALPFILSSCSTPPAPQAFHKIDDTALVVESLDDNTYRMIQPTISAKMQNDQLLTAAQKLSKHQTAVIILENYNEPQPGDEFRDRSTTLFVGLRTLGYEHISFLQGKGVTDPEGLLTVADYN